MKKFTEKIFYRLFKSLFSSGLRVYYKEIKVAGVGNVHIDRPIITASNHPTGLMDVFLAGYHIKRQIKFTAAGALFKNKLQAAFLTSVGTVPVYRRKDTPDEMDKNVESFEHCYSELEAGGAIGFYPEGTSHPEPWVNPIKTGAARVALQAENRNNFELGLKIIPIGINSLKPGAFRGAAFVNIGHPISLESYQELYQHDPIAATEQLTAKIQQEMEACTFHTKDELLLNLFEDLKTIGFDEVNVKNQTTTGTTAKFFFITKALENKISQNDTNAKNELENLAQKASELKKQMQKFGICNHPFEGIISILKFISLLFASLIGLPVVIPTFIVNILPFTLAKNLGRKLAGRDISLIPAARLMMGTVIYIIYYLLLFIIMGCFIGFVKSIIISFFLLIGGYLTLWYWEAVKAFVLVSRKIYLWFTNKNIMKELKQKRDEIINTLILQIQ